MTGEADDGHRPAPSRPLRVAVVGAGPAGIYTADHLTAPPRPGEEPLLPGGALVDLIERLPVPFGLLRYGVAPDHANIKATGRALGEVLARPAVRLFGNVEVGADLDVADLLAHYDAVVYALGASEDRALGIPGEELAGSMAARSFVDWYNGHPESAHPDLGRVESAAVVGVGNVAVDVARILLRDAEELTPTDVPQDVLEALRASRVGDVHLLGRRGPQHARFTTRELRELGDLAGVDVLVDDGQLPDEPPEGATPVTVRNLAVLRGWAARERTEAPRRLHLHFGARPVRVLGEDGVSGLQLERTAPDGSGTGETWALPVQAVLRAVGYRGTVPDGVPFDDSRAVIPTRDHRVLREGRIAPGEYAVGWAKRGPVGVIGTNRSDAKETVLALVADAPALASTRPHPPRGIADLLRARGVRHVDLEGWRQVVTAEARAGRRLGRAAVKISDWQELLDAAWEGAGG